MRRLLPFLAALALFALSPATAAAYVPPGFIGISPQNTLNDEDFALMERADIESVRLPMSWTGIQPENPSVQAPDWSEFDRLVGLAAEHHIRAFPFIWGTPEWASSDISAEPVETAWQRWGWSTFLRDVVKRYGPQGSFWDENEELPYLPIRKWEIWNEENIITFAHHPDPARFAKLIRLSGQVLHQADPGSKVIIGGLFGRPLQTPPNIQSGDFLSRLYRSRRVKPFFDGVALHPYVADAGAMTAEIENLRRVMRVHHDSSTPIYITELGLRQQRVALGEGPLRPGRGTRPRLLSAHRQPPALADRRRLVVLLARPERRLPVLRLGRPADRIARSKALLVQLQRLDRRRP